MKKILILTILTGLIFSGCVTQRNCAKKWPPQTVTIIKDSIREKIVWRDTTIFVQLDPITVTKTDTIYIKNGVVQFREIKAESNYATARAWIGQNRLNLFLADKDTTLELRLKNALRDKEYYLSKWNNEKQTVNVPYTPKFWKLAGWTGIASIILLLLYLGIRIKKKLGL